MQRHMIFEIIWTQTIENKNKNIASASAALPVVHLQSHPAKVVNIPKLQQLLTLATFDLHTNEKE